MGFTLEELSNLPNDEKPKWLRRAEAEAKRRKRDLERLQEKKGGPDVEDFQIRTHE